MIMFIFIGLGNPGEEYEGTRHNAGRMTVQYFAKKEKLGEFEEDKNLLSLVLEAQLPKAKEKSLFILPETFMNNSGRAIKRLVDRKILKISKSKEIKNLIVVHDDLDLPLGKFKISFGKNSAGHKGVESIMRALSTKNFVRIRIGISPKRKPDSKKILDFIIGRFKPKEKEILNGVFKKIHLAVEDSVLEGVSR